MIFNIVDAGMQSSAFEFTYTGTYVDNRVNGIGTIEFTSSGTLTILKAGIGALFMRGGGGGGGGGANSGLSTIAGGGGGGGSGYVISISNFAFAIGVFEIVIGNGGSGGDRANAAGMVGGPGSPGGTTSGFGHTAAGGNGGGGGTNQGGGAAGSGDQNGDAGGGLYDGVGGKGGTPNGGKGGNGTSYYIATAGDNGGKGIVTLTFAA